MTLAATLDLGQGHTATLIWREGTDRETGVPVGLLEMHGRCRTYVTWVVQDGQRDQVAPTPGERPVWNLVSLDPLTVEPGVICPTCGIVGLLTNGKYIDVTRVHRPQPAGGDQ